MLASLGPVAGRLVRGSVLPIAAMAVSIVLLGFAAAAAATATADNDYPTAARAEYVFACMAANGQTPDSLERCSCSIDVVASLLPYDRYVEAETVLRMRQLGGEKTVLFRDTSLAKHLVEDLRRAQAEGEVRCF